MRAPAASVEPSWERWVSRPSVRQPRIALYSHDTVGLGHLRRNLLIAQTLRRALSGAKILVVAGTAEANLFARPRGVDYLTLPALHKNAHGQYAARSLDIPVNAVIEIRARVMRAAMEAFQPDVLIVDKEPRGAIKELNPTLEYLRTCGDTRCVLGLRDFLDEPTAVCREWDALRNEDAIREYYDAIWVYGDRTVYDVAREYRFSPTVAEKIHYTGYLDRRARLRSTASNGRHQLGDGVVPRGPFVLCMLGGGQDGADLAEAFSQAQLPPETHGVMLLGPFMSSATRRSLVRRAAGNSRLHILSFVTEPTALLSRAERVISMGGYNTVSEVLSYEKPALIVPRVIPRREQLMRAERFRDLGLVDVCHPTDLTPGVLSRWLAKDRKRPVGLRDRIDFNGLSRVPSLLRELPGSFAARRHVV